MLLASSGAESRQQFAFLLLPTDFAKAPWTTNMISVDIKQAAFYAISKGWSLK